MVDWEILEEIKKIKKDINNNSYDDLTKDDTKQSLVLPIFRLLGYDELQQTDDEYIDFLLKDLNNEYIPIHCESVSTSITDIEISQLINSYEKIINANNSVRIAILTNGIKYLFFSNTLKYSTMDTLPLYNVNLHKDSNKDINVFIRFKKDTSGRTYNSKYNFTNIHKCSNVSSTAVNRTTQELKEIMRKQYFEIARNYSGREIYLDNSTLRTFREFKKLYNESDKISDNDSLNEIYNKFEILTCKL